MRFAVSDHNDATGRPAATQLAERLSLIEAYERLPTDVMPAFT